MSSSLTVLIPVDGSPNSEKAFDWYIKYFHQKDHRIIIYHSQEAPSLLPVSFKSGISGIPVEEWESTLKGGIEKVTKLKDHYSAHCHGLGISNHSVVSENANKPGEAICKYADANKVDMIVMGSRGLNTIRRTILGSVSDYVLHHALCPTTVIPSTDDAKK